MVSCTSAHAHNTLMQIDVASLREFAAVREKYSFSPPTCKFESLKHMFRTLRAITHLRGELVSDDRMDCPRVVEREMGAPDDMLAKCGGSSSVRGAHHHDQNFAEQNLHAV